MSYRVIRVSSDGGVVLLVMPFDAVPWAPGNRYFLRDPQTASEADSMSFEEVDENVAREYCTNMDREGAPEQPFANVDEVSHWAAQLRLRASAIPHTSPLC